MTPLAWDDGAPWACRVDVRREDAEGAYVVTGALQRDAATTMPLSEALLLLEDGLVVTRTHAARLHHHGALPWMVELRERQRVVVPVEERDALRDTLLASRPPTCELPEELRVEIRDGVPQPRLKVRPFRRDPGRLAAEATFDYDGAIANSDSPSALLRTLDGRVAIRRNPTAERAALDRLHVLGVRPSWNPDGHETVLQLSASALPLLARTLVVDGWHVEAEGRRYRLPTAPVAVEVRSGIDWFELHGEASFGDQHVSLPALLAAIERGDGAIALDDGTIGVVPEDWLRTYSSLALGARAGDHLRFSGSQVALLDALLAAQPAVSWDDTFSRARQRIQRFDTIAPLDPPRPLPASCATISAKAWAG